MKIGGKITLGLLLASVIGSTVMLGRVIWCQEKEQKKFDVLKEQILEVKMQKK